jgi:hypothetical protein
LTDYRRDKRRKIKKKEKKKLKQNFFCYKKYNILETVEKPSRNEAPGTDTILPFWAQEGNSGGWWCH